MEDAIPVLIDAYKDDEGIYSIGWGWGSPVRDLKIAAFTGEVIWIS